MDIKYPPLINVSAKIHTVRMVLGRVVIEAMVKGKDATMVLERDEARTLVASINEALNPRLG